MTELFWSPPIERGTKLHGTQSNSLGLVDHRVLALAAVSCPSLVPHLLQYLFSILSPIFLKPLSRRGRPRGAFRCNIDAAEFLAKIAVQIFVGCFFILGKGLKTFMAKVSPLNNSRFLSLNRMAVILMAVPSPQ